MDLESVFVLCYVCPQGTGVRKENGGSSVWGYQEIQEIQDQLVHQVRPAH